MKGVSKYKVPGGKLIEVRLEYNKCIEKLQILGDFFIHPEESLYSIESGLLNTRVDEEEEKIAEKINSIVHAKKIEMIGITPESIAKAIKMAVEK